MAKKGKKKGKSKSFATRLKKLQKNWANAVEEGRESGLIDMEDGTYKSRLTAMEVQESISSGNLQVMSEWTVIEGDSKGQSCRDYAQIERPESLKWFFMYLIKLGVDNAEELDFADLEDVCKDLVKLAPTGMVRLHTKGEYQNMRLLKLVETEDVDDDDEDDDDTDDGTDTDDGDDDDGDDDDGDADEDDGDADEDERDVEVGDTVKFKHKKKTVEGVVESVQKKKETVKVKVKKKKELIKVAWDKLEILMVEEDDDD